MIQDVTPDFPLKVVVATPFAAAALVATTPGGLTAAIRPKTTDVHQ